MRTAGSKGCFVAVVGPSGAGKDTVMDAARAALVHDPQFHFVRRVVTRAPVPGAEDHDSLDEQAFLAAAEKGAFALHWEAHELNYGLPATLFDELAAGKVVIANLSRHALPQMRKLFAVRSVVLITARAPVLAQRLAARGRESREDIERRLVRAVPLEDTEGDLTVIDNSGTVAASTATFVSHLRDMAEKSKTLSELLKL